MPLPPFIRETRPRDPRTIPDLTLWLDASDPGSLWDATSGGSTPAADGAVARWTDKGPSAFSFTQGTANNRPLRRVASQGGLDGVQFDGSNDAMYAAANVMDTGWALLAVVKMASATARAPICDLNNGSSGTGSNFFCTVEANTYLSTTSRWGSYTCNSSYDNTGVVTTSPTVLTISANATSGNTLVGNTAWRVNGAPTTNTLRAGGGTYGNLTGASDRGVMLGAYNSNGTASIANAGMTLYELCVWNRQLTASELIWLERYAAAKWRISQ